LPDQQGDQKQAPSEPLDLTKKELLPRATLAAPPASVPYDPEPERELVRGRLAKGLVLVAALSLMAFSFVPAGLMGADKLGTFFGAVVALAGTALGFYFGGKR
jgi:hypothetical protein